MRADRIVLQALKDPVMHLLRNAISHGIETREERASKGKSPVGSLTLRLDSQRGRLIVEVEDDGRGVDLKKVAKVLSEAEPGCALARRAGASHLPAGFFHFRHREPSVRTGHGALGGLRNRAPPPGRCDSETQGKRRAPPFSCRCPCRSPPAICCCFRAAGQTFGIPTHGIERLYRIRLEQVETLQGKPVVILEGQPVPLYGLAHLLQIGERVPGLPGDMLPVMVLKSGTGVSRSGWMSS